MLASLALEARCRDGLAKPTCLIGHTGGDERRIVRRGGGDDGGGSSGGVGC
jgi:hypothetical protein